MAKKVILKDQNNVEILPITRGELVLDSSGKEAFHSNKFLATVSQPGLMSHTDKEKLDTLEKGVIDSALSVNSTNAVQNKVITLVLNSIKESYLKSVTVNGNTLTIVDQDGTSHVFNNTNNYRPISVDGVSILGNDNTALNLTAGSNITLTPETNSSGKYTGKVIIKSNYDNTTYTLSGTLSGNTYVTTLTPSSGNASTATVPSLVGASTSKAGSAGLVPAPKTSDTNLFLKGDGTWSLPTTKLYVGSKNNASNASTSNNATYIKLFDNSTLRNQFLIKGTGNTTITSDTSGNITINSPTTISWNSITNIPSSFIPSNHEHSSNQIKDLTGYTKASSATALSTSDSLNTALGKLEYKADLGVAAYNWYIGVTGTDNDDIINKWGEIVDFVDSVKEGSDILTAFVTTDTQQTISGNKTFTGTVKFGTTTLGSTSSPIYLKEGSFTKCSTYAGGTKVTLNGTGKGASTASFYAPTEVGSNGYVLVSNGSGEPSWANVNTLVTGVDVSSVTTGTYSLVAHEGDDLYSNTGIYLNAANASLYAFHYFETSDVRFKTNIKSIDSYDNIPILREFDWKDSGKHSYGLIAQELEEQGYSELVDNEGDHKTVNYSAALSLIVAKLQNKISELEKEIKNLKNIN